MTLKTYLVLSALALLVIGWLWFGPVVLALAFCAAMLGLFSYAIARLFFAVIHRLER